MPPFECDNIMYRPGDHKPTEDKFNANTIAEAVVVWGITNEFDDIDDSIDDYYHLETLEQLNIIISTVINFSNVFEFEFEQLFSKHCNENMSEKQFIDFVDTRCNLLGTIKGYFGYILPCAFVREIIFRFKNHFECSHFCILAQQCLAKFLEKKFMELKREGSCDAFMNYCRDINDQFLEKVHSKSMASDESDDDFCMEPPSTFENVDTIWMSTELKDSNGMSTELKDSNGMSTEQKDSNGESTEQKDANGMSTELKDANGESTEQKDANEFKSYGTANDTIGKLVSSDVDRTDSATMSLYTNSGNYSLEELSNDALLSRKKSDTILELSKSISKIYFESVKEEFKAEENDTNDSKVCLEDEKERCEAEENDTNDSKICFENEKEQYKAENDVNDSVCSSDSSYDSSFDNTCSKEEDELTDMYNIIMPDGEFVEEVFDRIEGCFEFFDKTNDEDNRAKLDDNSGLKSDNLDNCCENKLTLPILLKIENLHGEMSINKDSLDNIDFLTNEPYERKYCIQCKTSVHSSQNPKFKKCIT